MVYHEFGLSIIHMHRSKDKIVEVRLGIQITNAHYRAYGAYIFNKKLYRILGILLYERLVPDHMILEHAISKAVFSKLILFTSLVLSFVGNDDNEEPPNSNSND